MHSNCWTAVLVVAMLSGWLVAPPAAQGQTFYPPTAPTSYYYIPYDTGYYTIYTPGLRAFYRMPGSVSYYTPSSTPYPYSNYSSNLPEARNIYSNPRLPDVFDLGSSNLYNYPGTSIFYASLYRR